MDWGYDSAGGVGPATEVEAQQDEEPLESPPEFGDDDIVSAVAGSCSSICIRYVVTRPEGGGGLHAVC